MALVMFLVGRIEELSLHIELAQELIERADLIDAIAPARIETLRFVHHAILGATRAILDLRVIERLEALVQILDIIS
jgi:hypothetical protein